MLSNFFFSQLSYKFLLFFLSEVKPDLSSNDSLQSDATKIQDGSQAQAIPHQTTAVNSSDRKNNQSSVLGKEKAKKRLLAFSLVKSLQKPTEKLEPIPVNVLEKTKASPKPKKKGLFKLFCIIVLAVKA